MNMNMVLLEKGVVVKLNEWKKKTLFRVCFSSLSRMVDYQQLALIVLLAIHARGEQVRREWNAKTKQVVCSLMVVYTHGLGSCF